MPNLIKKIFYNKEKPLSSWLNTTLALIVFYPLYFYFLRYLSFLSPTQAGATIFRTGTSLGIILLPSIALIDFKAKAKGLIASFWALLVIIAILAGSAIYSKYQRTTSEEFAQTNIPAYENAALQEIAYSPGNIARSPEVTMIFNLEESTTEPIDIIKFYNQELKSKGWMDKLRENTYHNDSFSETQTWETFQGKDWYLKVGPNNTKQYTISLAKTDNSNDQYSVNIIFPTCNDSICKFEYQALQPTLNILNSIGL